LDEGVPPASQFPHKSQVLEIHKHDLKESHKMEILTRIYFGKQDKVGRNGGEGRKISCF
jgi:hypothetical protein